MEITIIGLGTGDSGMLTLAALNTIAAADMLILQTDRYPVAAYLREKGYHFETLDALYEEAEDFDELARLGAERVLKLAAGNTVFGIIGSIAENAVARELSSKAEIKMLPGVTFGDFAKDSAMSAVNGARIVSASDFTDTDARSTLIVTELDSVYKAAEISTKLLELYPHDTEVLLISPSHGKLKTQLSSLPSADFFSPDCSLVIEPVSLTEKAGYTLPDLVELIAMLRSENGCPWDKAQTHASLREFLLEEAAEAVDAINQDDPFMLSDELGDVLMQVVLHAQIATEHGDFNMCDILTGLCEKLIRRHEHIFGSIRCETPEEVLNSWNNIKRKEKGQSTQSDAMRGISPALPSLTRAMKIQKKAASDGFDWQSWEGALEKLYEELIELNDAVDTPSLEEEAGDVLFSIVNVLRKLGINGEVALSLANSKFIRRYTAMENLSKEPLSDISTEALEILWQKIKNIEK